MAKSKITLLEDPRYPEFVDQFHGDPLRFAVEVCGLSPSDDQIELFTSMEPPRAKVSVVSGTGTGKTFGFARIALWHLLCHPVAFYEGKVEIGSNTYIGAPTISQVGAGVWKEFSDAIVAMRDGPHAWICDYFTKQAESVYVNGFADQWYIKQVAMPKGQSIAVAGKHRYWQMIIVDEAAGVSDSHFNVIDGTQTQGGNRTLLASQGARNTGRFYDTHHSLKLENGGSWKSLRMSSENSPFVTSEWLQQRMVECGGRQTVEYKIRIRGMFATDSSNMLLTREDMEEGFKPRRIIGDDEPYGLVILSDVGAGEYRDDSVGVVAKIIGDGDFGDDARRVEFYAIPLCTNTRNGVDFSGDLVALFGSLSNATLYVDSGGMGGMVCKLIERSGVPVVRVSWGNPCWKTEYKARFYNQRACAMVRFRDAVKQGRAVFPQGLDPMLREKIINQGSRLPFYFSETGGLRYVMTSKKEMAQDGIKSPDVIDSMSFAFLEDCHYTPIEGAGRGENAGGSEQALDDLEKRLSQVLASA